MAKTRLFVIRHGRTMFNTIGRAQGWSDTPLTAEGERGIEALGIGLRESGLEFTRAYSSDSGRAIQTMGIILDELGLKDQIPYRFDKRIREWCFGSFDGAYGGELFHGVVPRVLDVEDYKTLTLEDLANGICQVDTANWTIQTLVCLIEGKPNLNLPLSNGSVTLVEYEDGVLTVKGIGDSSYREVGESLQES